MACLSVHNGCHKPVGASGGQDRTPESDLGRREPLIPDPRANASKSTSP